MEKTFPSKFLQLLCSLALWSLLCSASLFASITATPKFVFLDGTRKSTPIHISNSGEEDREVWIDISFGYVTTDDTGKVVMNSDSLESEGFSAAPWIQVFPKRFNLGQGETQTIRLTTTPPPGLKDGEYWARVLITSKPRKPPVAAVPNQTTRGSGMVLLTQVSLPFHFRAGRVVTGVEVTGLQTVVEGTDLNVNFKLTRTGNSSYWGTRTLRIIDRTGKILYTSSKNAVVYKSFNVLEKLTTPKGLPPGSYKVEVELATGKRTDIRKEDLLSAPPLKVSVPLEIK